MTNREISKIFKQVSIVLEMDDVAFKSRIYEDAAAMIVNLEDELSDIYKKGGREILEKYQGIGESLAKKIETLIKKGKLPYYEKLKKKYPIDLLSLNAIEGIGPKHIKVFYEKLKIKNLDDLEMAIKADKIKALEGFGKKSQQNIYKNLLYQKQHINRWVLGFIYSDLEKIFKRLQQVKGVVKLEIAGSVRRRKPVIGDFDLLAVCKEPARLMDTLCSLSEVEQVLVKGDVKASVRLRIGLEIDLRIIPNQSFGAALCYFTGSRAHTIALRKLAFKKGYTLNEYGLFNKKSNKLLSSKSEKSVYSKLGLQFIPPELRQGRDELEMAQKREIPKLIADNDLRGDLQIQTSWTDGANTIEEMAKQAIKIGHEYINITDHTQTLKIVRGLNEVNLFKQGMEIDRLNKKFKGKIKILKGTELNILKNGDVDIKDDVLVKLDVVGAAIHTDLKLSKARMTVRLCRAMQNPNIDIIFHPMGRRFFRNPPYLVDMDEVIRVARQTNTVLEIDVFPDRMDLDDIYIRKAIRSGVKMSIDTDSHHRSHLKYIQIGIGYARRGGVGKKNIINTRPWRAMLSLLK